jgi:hypothetical protein
MWKVWLIFTAQGNKRCFSQRTELVDQGPIKGLGRPKRSANTGVKLALEPKEQGPWIIALFSCLRELLYAPDHSSPWM